MEENEEVRTGWRRTLALIFLFVCLGTTLYCSYQLRKYASLYDQLGMYDQLPVVQSAGFWVAFLFHPWGWILWVGVTLILALAVRKGVLDWILPGLNVVTLGMTLLMALATWSSMMSLAQLQRALQE